MKSESLRAGSDFDGALVHSPLTHVSVSAASRPISTSIIQFGETGAKPLFQQTPFLFGGDRHGFDLLDNSVETIEYFF